MSEQIKPKCTWRWNDMDRECLNCVHFEQTANECIVCVEGDKFEMRPGLKVENEKLTSEDVLADFVDYLIDMDDVADYLTFDGIVSYTYAKLLEFQKVNPNFNRPQTFYALAAFVEEYKETQKEKCSKCGASYPHDWFNHCPGCPVSCIECGEEMCNKEINDFENSTMSKNYVIGREVLCVHCRMSVILDEAGLMPQTGQGDQMLCDLAKEYKRSRNWGY